MAVKDSLMPSATLGADGVIAIDTNVAAVTVKVTAGEVTLPSAAVI